ncbi:MAG: hypothetical protein ACYDEB_10195 [Dehalococcoidia bacterium]
MQSEPVFEKSIHVRPLDYTLTVRARPASIRRTVLRLLPWALYIALPEGRLSRMAHAFARRTSPLAKQNVR